MLRFLADWQEADGFLRDKIAQAKTDEPITSLAALQAAEALVRERRAVGQPKAGRLSELGLTVTSRDGPCAFCRRLTTSVAS